MCWSLKCECYLVADFSCLPEATGVNFQCVIGQDADPFYSIYALSHDFTGGNHLKCTGFSQLPSNKQKVVHSEQLVPLLLM